MTKPTIIIQARTGSSRFSRKVLAKIENKPMIWHIIERMKRVGGVEQIILVTTKNFQDKILLKIADDCNIKSFKGKTRDVLDRYYKCAIEFDADPIIRITGDCPLIDPYIVEEMLNHYMRNNYDYLTNTFPPTFPDGLDIEIFSFKTLKKMARNARLLSEKEHVTAYIRNNPNKFRIFNYENQNDLSYLRWTVDEKSDLLFVKKIYEKMRPKIVFEFNDVLEILHKNPEIIEINKGITRNEGYAKSLKNDRKIK